MGKSYPLARKIAANQAASSRRRRALFPAMRTLWRACFAHLATAARLKAVAQSHRLGIGLARQYTGGNDADEATTLAHRLYVEHGLRASLFHLGEYVADAAAIEAEVYAKCAAAAALGEAGLDVHVSVDPTQIGLLQGRSVFLHHLDRIGDAVAAASRGRPGRHALMLDMEDASVTDATLEAHARLQASGRPAAVTLQAYRHRTVTDLIRLIETGAMVRLVKGAFPAGPELALQRAADVTHAYVAHATTLLSPQSRARGVYPVFATHDHRLHEVITAEAGRQGWSPEEWEFEMLLGARDDIARNLAQRGHRVRLYVPFGSDWWPYAMRRIGENPGSLTLVLRGALSHG
jgi:proline dehydrogenase